jgi:hypothetical protein
MGRRTLLRRAGILAVLGAAAAALSWTVPLAVGKEKSKAAKGQLEACALSAHQPEEPFESNSAVLDRVRFSGSGADPDIVKTVAMEKEIYECGNGAVIDSETFVEILEQHREVGFGGMLTRPVISDIEAVTCTKDFVKGSVDCAAREVPLRDTFDPLRGCTPAAEQPRDPVEMNTIAVGLNSILTTKVEKEVLACGDRVGELFIYSEIHERPRGDPAGFGPVSKRFEVVACFKSRVTSSAEKAGPEECLRQSAKPQ